MDKRTIDVDGEKAEFFAFDTATEMADYVKRECPGAQNERRPDWMGGTWREAFERARMGQADYVPRSDALLAKMERQIEAAPQMFQNVRSVAGGAPNVPAYLANQPLAMRQRRRVRSQQAPLVIFVNHWLQADVEVEDVERRGVAVLALVRALCGIRPVSLYAHVGLGMGTNMLLAFRVETAPLDLARAAWACASPNIIRHFGHALLGKVNGCDYMGGFPLDGAEDALARELGFSEYLDTGNMTGGDAFRTDDEAAAWVLEKIKEHGGDMLAA